MKNIQILNPFLLGHETCELVIYGRIAHYKGGGGGGSSEEYERQLREQRQATEKAEAEAARLKGESEAAAKRRKERQNASLLTPGEGSGDDTVNTRRSLLGSGS